MPYVGHSIAAGCDGTEVVPIGSGRLNSAPQTVLKTAGMASSDVDRGPLQFDFAPADSMTVSRCPLVSTRLAVFLAVNNRSRLSDARAL
jgi:hypothetical protein